MLDRESEIYNSGVLREKLPEEHAAIVVTREGVEVSASSRGFNLRYSNTWKKMTQGWEETDRKVRARRRLLEIERAPSCMEN